MKDAKQRRILFFRIRNSKGQSTVEYLVVTAALVASLITLPNLYNIISHTMQDKYNSYAFGVSISDPPSKDFDDTVKSVADEVHHILETLKGLWNILTHSILRDLLHGKMPSTSAIKKFIDLIKSLFS